MNENPKTIADIKNKFITSLCYSRYFMMNNSASRPPGIFAPDGIIHGLRIKEYVICLLKKEGGGLLNNDGGKPPSAILMADPVRLILPKNGGIDG
ncbi:hypothetical protein NBH20_15425 [Rhizobium sp. S153]|uniref:Uncharacterized protein n=1 Tax=Ciceribacter sichuanensis TaxID=2949647 RepID=A0ABT0V9Q1_9HYPH|nr:hypothetical protein [Ciceribacter sp. S153]MCM2402556.1 hypothetical protein [Ciceribacter sp. S153]